MKQYPVRYASVAGSFYPDDKRILENEIGLYLRCAKILKTAGKLKILIAPHAGIKYSGQVAAWGYKQLENQPFQKIILLGASHHTSFSHAAVYSAGVWQTPLGKVEIESDLADKIIDRNIILSDSESHETEHCLEMQLIFLQKVLDDFKIVPVLVSRPSVQLIHHLARKISRQLDEKSLLIVSSDFSHYPEYDNACKIDQDTIGSIVSGDLTKFSETIKRVENGKCQNLFTCACGQEAIKTALNISQLSNIKNIRLLKYENSGDRGTDKSQVVGYASIGFYE